jgi:hypothetical protein
MGAAVAMSVPGIGTTLAEERLVSAQRADDT